MADAGIEDLNAEDRRKKILEILTQEGRIKVADLSRLFGTSEVTIRSDLSGLEAEGLLERVHGGAVSTYKAYYNMSLLERMKTNEEEKRRLAVEAAGMISDGDTLFVSSGTTTLYVVQELKNIKNLTIVTNFMPVSHEIGHYRNIHIILLGGSLNTQYQFTYGDDTICQLKKYNADKLILSVDGVKAGEGISTNHYFDAEVNRQMISRVNKTILVADHSKIGRTSFVYIDPVDRVDQLVTSRKANQAEIDALIETGMEVRLV